MGILSAAAFVVRYTYHLTKGKSPYQIVFGRDMTLHINHIVTWGYIYQLKQEQVEKA